MLFPQHSQTCVILVRPSGLSTWDWYAVHALIWEWMICAWWPLRSRSISLKVRKFAMHAQQLLGAMTLYGDLSEAVADCGWVVATSAHRRLRGRMEACAVADLPGEIRRREPGRTALVFGNEADGLSNEELSVCQTTVRLVAPGPARATTSVMRSPSCCMPSRRRNTREKDAGKSQPIKIS